MRITTEQEQASACAQGPLCGGRHSSQVLGSVSPQPPLQYYHQGQRSHLPLKAHYSNPQRTGNYQRTTASLPGLPQFLDRWKKNSPSLTQLPSIQWVTGQGWSQPPLPYDATAYTDPKPPRLFHKPLLGPKWWQNATYGTSQPPPHQPGCQLKQRTAVITGTGRRMCETGSRGGLSWKWKEEGPGVS